MTTNGRRAWRLIVRLPDVDPETAPAVFRWIREHVIPTALEAPVQVTVELLPPDDDRGEE